MASNSKIEWTNATWNCIAGCTPVSAGCANCYAIKDAHRMAGNPNLKIQSAYQGLTVVQENGVIGWAKTVRLLPERLTLPLKWKQGKRIFVNSQSDLFHVDVPFEFIDQVFAVMALCPQHTFQILTKRPERMAEYLNSLTAPSPTAENLWSRCEHVYAAMLDMAISTGKKRGFWSQWPLPNVWLGTSVEDQKTANERIPHLLEVPAVVRFLSCEPLLGALDISPWVSPRSFDEIIELDKRDPDAAENAKERFGCVTKTIEVSGKPYTSNGFLEPLTVQWVIAGGESGPRARPAHPDWFRGIRDQCQKAGVPFFFKQWGEWKTVYDRDNNLMPPKEFLSDEKKAPKNGRYLNLAGGHGFHGERVHFIYKVGKKAAGRVLDGRTWDEFPETVTEGLP